MRQALVRVRIFYQCVHVLIDLAHNSLTLSKSERERAGETNLLNEIFFGLALGRACLPVLRQLPL